MNLSKDQPSDFQQSENDELASNLAGNASALANSSPDGNVPEKLTSADKLADEDREASAKIHAPIGTAASRLLRQSATRMKAAATEKVSATDEADPIDAEIDSNAHEGQTFDLDIDHGGEDYEHSAIESDTHYGAQEDGIDLDQVPIKLNIRHGADEDGVDLDISDDSDVTEEVPIQGADEDDLAYAARLLTAFEKLEGKETQAETTEVTPEPELTDIQKKAIKFLNAEAVSASTQSINQSTFITGSNRNFGARAQPALALSESTRAPELAEIAASSHRYNQSYLREHGGFVFSSSLCVCFAGFVLAVFNTFAHSHRTENQLPASSISQLSLEIAERPAWVNLYKERAKKYISSGKYDLAIRDFRKVLKLEPNENAAGIWAEIASCNEKLKRYDQAASNYTMAMKEAPSKSAKYASLRAACYIRLKEYDQAGMDYETVLGTTPGDAETHFLVGHLFYLRNQYAKAIPHFSDAIAINANPKYSLERANSYFAMKQFNHALYDYDQVLKVQPDLKEASTKRAIAMARAQKTVLGGDQAVGNRAGKQLSRTEMQTLSSLVKTAPSQVMQKGNSLLESSNPSQAVDVFALVVKANANDLQARLSLARALVLIDDNASAANQFTAAAELQPLSTSDKFLYAQALASAGRINQSISVYRSVIQQNDHSLDAELKLIDLLSSKGMQDKAEQECKMAMANPKFRNAISQLSDKLNSMNQQTVQSSAPQTDGNNPAVTEMIQPVPSQSISHSQPTPSAPPVSIGNNQAINPWGSYKGMQKRN